MRTRPGVVSVALEMTRVWSLFEAILVDKELLESDLSLKKDWWQVHY